MERVMIIGTQLGVIVIFMIGGIVVIVRLAGGAGDLISRADQGVRGFRNNRKQRRAESRKGRRERNMEKLAGGKLLSEDGRFRRTRKAINVAGRGAYNAGDVVGNGGWKVWNPRNAIGNYRAMTSTSERKGKDAMAEDDDYKLIKGNGDVTHIMLESSLADETSDELYARLLDYHGGNTAQAQRDLSIANKLKRKYTKQQYEYSNWLATMGDGTVFGRNGQEEVEAWQMLGDIAGDDQGLLADGIVQGRSAATNAGRFDLGNLAFSSTLKAARSRDNPNANFEFREAVANATPASMASHQSNKPYGFENFVEHQRDLVNAAIEELNMTTEGTDEHRAAQAVVDARLADVAQTYDSAAQSKRELADVMQTQMLEMTAVNGQRYEMPDGTVRPLTYREMIEEARQRPADPTTGQNTFLSRRRELTASERFAGGIGGTPVELDGGGHTADFT